MTEIDILDRAFQWTKDEQVAAWINEAKAEIQQLRDRHGHLSKMLGEAAEIIDQQTREIGELQSDLEMFLVEGVVFRTYDDEDQERIEDTRLVMAKSEINAIRKYEKWWEDQSEDQVVSYCAYAVRVKGVIE